MILRLPLDRLCKKHVVPIESVSDGDREKIVCKKGHRVTGWLIVDAKGMWVGLGHKDNDGTIFDVPKPLPEKLKDRNKKRKPIPFRPCKYGHMDWVPFVTKDGKNRHRCNACQTKRFRKLKKEGEVVG